MADYELIVDPQQMFSLRTTAKRAHTRLLNAVADLLNRAAPRQALDNAVAALLSAYERVIAIHNRYVVITDLDDQELHAANVYHENIRSLHDGCLATVAESRNKQMRRPSVSWTVDNLNRRPSTGSVTPPAIAPNADLITQAQPIEEQQPRNGKRVHHQRVTQENDDIEEASSESFLAPINTGRDEYESAKRRKIDLEFQLKKQEMQREREQRDLQLKFEREREDTMLEIEKQSLLMGEIVQPGEPQHSSTPAPRSTTRKSCGTTPLAGPSTYIPSHGWPKLQVAKFDGDPRSWTKFANGINATLRDTNMPESWKLLALQESMFEHIQKRVAHVFANSDTFECAWNLLEARYGDPGLIIKAHDTHLQQLPSFRTGDFDGLFKMATAVRDAVSSVSSEHIGMFMSVVGSLHTKLPNYLQADWSKHAYLLRRIPTLKDFDVWIDTIMGAEELRGAKISTPGGSSGNNKPPNSHTNGNRQPGGSSNYGARNGPTILNNSAQSLLRQTNVECPACNDKSTHRLDDCNTFARMTVNARAVLCAQNNHCFKCLIKGHYSSKCRRQNANCPDCGAAHHKLLHGAERQFPAKVGPKILMVKSPLNSIKPVLLAIVPVVIEAKGEVKSTFAVLDPGSEATLITRPLASFLNLKGSPTVIRFGSFSSSVEMLTDVVSFSLHSLDKACSFKLEDAFVVPKINLSHGEINWPAIKHRWSHLAKLDLPAIDSSNVEILLGMDVAAAHQTLQMLEPLAGEDGPTVYRTRFGLAVVGRIPKSLVTGPTTRKAVNLQTVPPLLPCMMDRTHPFQQPTARISAARNLQQQEDSQMLDIMKRSIKFITCGYQIDLPLRTDHPEIPNNRNQALSRFHGLEHRLTQPSMRELANQYEQVIDKLISSGTVVPVVQSTIDKPKGLVWYLPHFFVTNPNKPGKIRVVFDAAARFRSVSYNDLFLRGPPSIPSLVGVLLRSRQFRVALSADITAFYHRVGVAKHHQPLQRFVFRNFGSEAQIKTYQFTTLIFGAICSSSAAVFALQHAADKCVEFPTVAEKMKDNFYSDNMIDSFETEEEAMDFARQVAKSLEAGGFTLTAFASSSTKVLESIPKQHRSPRPVDLTLDGLQIEYQLGLEWDITTDTFGIRARQLPSVATRRQLLSAISLVFDPLGLCLPVITGAKLIFQKTQKDSNDDRSRRGWDSPLPEETQVKWNDWTNHFHKLSFPRIPRCFRDHSFPLQNTSLRLVVYADASSVAYAAVAYLRCQFEQKVTVNFVMAKGRLASLKPTTVPRLELRAAVLAVELSLIIKKELRLPIAGVEYHSDSKIVLHQLHSGGTKQPTFVNKRREYILQHSKVDSWHFVPSADNPADDSTRSTVPKDFGISCRWNFGPPMLRDPSYAPEPFTPSSVKPSEEEPPIVSVNQLQAEPSPSHPHADQISKLIKKADQLHLLKREVAQLLRSDAAKKEEPSANELAEAFRICLNISQDEEFPGERKALLKKGKISNGSPLRRLCPYIDSNDGLMKVDGRLRHAELPARTRNPIIISSHHLLTRLIVEDRHVKLHHAGIEHTLSVVRQDFYLPQGRSTIRRALRQCIKCRMQHAMPQPPRMANLPKERLQGFVRVFTNVGLDCFGPFHVVIGRKTAKRYGLLVTCLASHAVHLEVLDSMDADSFIMALRRFISYRGCPKVIYSDNGTNIVAGQKELEQGIANLNSTRVEGEMVDAGIDWRKSAPSCAHEGGVWERLIGSSKAAMRAILESRSVSDEVLRTVFAEVTSLLNSRPLTHVHTDPSEPEPLTPNHFLIGGPHPHRVPDDEQAFDGVTRRRWKQAQFIVDQFWRRWMREYLPSLIERKKWEKSVRPLRVGDKVLIMDENLKRGEWLIGNITAVHPGDDGVIRKATVQTARSTLLRPAVKLCFISGDRNG